MVRPGRAVISAGTAAAVGLAVHTAVNLRRLRTPSTGAPTCTEPVTVLIPARDEALTIEATVRSVLAQEGVDDLSLIVLDDDSSDDTAALVAAIDDPRLTLLRGTGDVPAGWLGKPWACARLAMHASGTVLVFVDADVVLAPHAVRALVADLRDNGLAMVAPYPHQEAGSWLERLVQPLVTWSWAATLPVGIAEKSGRPSLSAANGQVLAVDAAAYRAAGGHGAVQGQVLEDIALMRAIKVSGGRAATVDGSGLATCRMYASPSDVVDGYGKSLWSAFGGPVESAAVCSLLALAYLAPAAAMIGARTRRTRAIGATGYVAGVTSRALVARRTGEPVIDSLAQPASIAAFVALNAVSWWRHRRGTNRWKGRDVVAR